MRDRSKQLTSILKEVKTHPLPDADTEQWETVCDQGIAQFEEGGNHKFDVDIARRRDTICKEVTEVLTAIINEEKLELDINDPVLDQIRGEVLIRLIIVRGLERLNKDDKDAVREMIDEKTLSISDARKEKLTIIPILNEALKGFADKKTYPKDEDQIERKRLAAEIFGEYLAKALGRKNPIIMDGKFQIKKESDKPSKSGANGESTEVPAEQNPKLQEEIGRSQLATELLENSVVSLSERVEEEITRLYKLQAKLIQQRDENNIEAIQTQIVELEAQDVVLNTKVQDLGIAFSALKTSLGETHATTLATKSEQAKFIEQREEIAQQAKELEESKEGKGPIVEQLNERIGQFTLKIESLEELLEKLKTVGQDTLRLLDQVTQLTTEN